MRRVLLTTISLLAFTATAAVAADLPRRDARQGAGLCAGRLQLDRLLPRHQRRLRLGPFALERLRHQRGSVRRHGRRHRRLQLAGARQPVGVRSRRRHRLDQHQGHASPTPTCPTGCQTKNNWLGTVRGRVGYAWDRVMPYVTGGLAVGDIEANQAGFAGVHDTNVGWTAGGGVEAALAGNWTAKLEYLHVDLGHINCGAVSVLAADPRRLPCRRSARRRELPVLIVGHDIRTQKPRTKPSGAFAFAWNSQTIFVQSSLTIVMVKIQ